MRLTRLEIFGFKSFVERFSLQFDQNLIGIVGPNGCGKSNVVDSLRWVLGETHAKQLRGAKQEDLIFNGSEKRRALGLAEVSITIQPDENWSSRAMTQRDELETILSSKEVQEEGEQAEQSSEDAKEEQQQEVVEQEQTEQEETGSSAEKLVGNVNNFLAEIPELLNATEIQFTRRLYRSGESEYLINRVPCRLRDMIDIYRFIGLGSRGLNIVQQGQIGELISKKPIERREILEEAAGISGFRSKLEASQRKLSRTNDNLARIKDIEVEVEKQVRVLKRQATRAKMRNELKEKLTSIDIDWYTKRLVQIALRKHGDQSNLDQLQEQVREADAKFSEADARFNDSQAHLEEQDQRLFELRRKRDSWANVLRQEQERLQGVEKELVRFETESESLDAQGLELNDREQKVFSELESRNQDKHDVELELQEFQSSKDQAEEILQNTRNEVATKLAEIESSIAQKILQTEQNLPAANIETLQADIATLEQEIQSGGSLKSERHEAQSKLRAVQKNVKAKELQKASLEAEKQTLEKQSKLLAKHVSTAIEEPGEDLSTLASGLLVAEQYQKALQAALWG